MLEADGRIEIVHRYNPGIDERDCVYVKCEDEWAVEGLEKAWTSYVWFRRRVPPSKHCLKKYRLANPLCSSCLPPWTV